LVATVSAFGDGGHREPWAFDWFHKPTLLANREVGMATKAGIFIEALHDPAGQQVT